ncbi:MAG: putative bacterial non-heme ferritin-like protein [Vicingaceae bacterium]|nr:MAG: putative bacterial non-heme ferritin-like protein [Vicingaceae bacterium]
MISKKIEKALNEQVKVEAMSSHIYLGMASWAEINGFQGVAEFLYKHSDEERMHMLKLIRYINERGGKATVPSLEAPPVSYAGLNEIFEKIYDHEVKVTKNIHSVVDLCLKEKDYTTHNFMQWYVAEQIEEEALARTILDKLKLIGNDKGGLYLFDRDIATLENNGN